MKFYHFSLLCENFNVKNRFAIAIPHRDQNLSYVNYDIRNDMGLKGDMHKQIVMYMILFKTEASSLILNKFKNDLKLRKLQKLYILAIFAHDDRDIMKRKGCKRAKILFFNNIKRNESYYDLFITISYIN